MVHIERIDPTSAQRDSEFTLNVYGNGFTSEGTYVLVNARVPVTKFISEGHLEVSITKETSGTTGEKSVKVHDSAGNLSNEVILTIRD